MPDENPTQEYIIPGDSGISLAVANSFVDRKDKAYWFIKKNNMTIVDRYDGLIY